MRVIVTADGPFVPLIDYFAEHQTRSLGWKSQVAYVTGLLIDFMHAKASHYVEPDRRQLLLADFALALRDGTIEDGDDPSGLYWEGAAPERTNLLLALLCAFADWLAESHGVTALNPGRPSTLAEQIRYWRRWNSRRSTDLLKHLPPSETVRREAQRSRTGHPFQAPAQQGGERVKKFPEDRIPDLLFKGFVVRGGESKRAVHLRYKIRDILITILMHGGGVRESEPFHLFVNDVVEDPNFPGRALVRIYHPEDGGIAWIDPLTGRRIRTTRREFLARIYGREPRNRLAGKEHAGWKNPALTDARNEKFFQVFWFPAFWGELFWALYKIYVLHVYPKHRLDHPYLFVNLNKRHFGDPYTLATFNKNHAAAVRRIGLSPEKGIGTTPHGHRHATGARMDRASVPGKIQTVVMHHTNPLSRLKYNERTAAEVQKELAASEPAIAGVVEPSRLNLERIDEEINTFLATRNPAHKLTL
jgi:integrase